MSESSILPTDDEKQSEPSNRIFLIGVLTSVSFMLVWFLVSLVLAWGLAGLINGDVTTWTIAAAGFGAIAFAYSSARVYHVIVTARRARQFQKDQQQLIIEMMKNAVPISREEFDTLLEAQQPEKGSPLPPPPPHDAGSVAVGILVGVFVVALVLGWLAFVIWLIVTGIMGVVDNGANAWDIFKIVLGAILAFGGGGAGTRS